MPNYFRRISHIYLLFIPSIFLSCSKDQTSIMNEVGDENLVFNSFVLEKKNNPHLTEDIVFNIGDKTISAELQNYFFNSVPTFTTNAQNVEISYSKQISGSSEVDFRKTITYTLKSSSAKTKEYKVNITWDDAIAHVYFDTNGSEPIVSKDYYLYGNLRIDGKSRYQDLTILNSITRIKGRGNSTWSWPKKPYKIKLDSDESVLGLLPAKEWVLLADYQDGPHLLNSVAFTIGRMLEMPFTNTIVPVELTINGEYLGLYGLTEQIEVKPNRVDVGSDGLLLELEQYFDEDWKFRSASYNLPVMVKDPTLSSQTELDLIRTDFEIFEALVARDDFPNNNYLDYIDEVSIAKYFIVYMLTSNEEINHPKSTYMHKTANGKYAMGPIWDFDWAYGFEGSYTHFVNPNKPLFWNSSASGAKFFKRLMLTDPKIKLLIKDYWLDFTSNHLEKLMKYIDDQTFVIKGAKYRDLQMWNHGFVNDEALMKSWIRERVSYMNSFIYSL